MSYKIEIETQALRELGSLPKEIQKRLGQAIDDLQKNPRPPGAKKLTSYEGFRVRKGDYRILYTIGDGQRQVRIYRIGHRREVYR